MAKAPRAGEVKTRLEPLLGAEGCARLQAALVREATRWAFEVAPGAVYVAYAPAAAEAEVRELVPDGVALLAQEGRDLGERLATATERVLASAGGPLIVVGTDAPTLRRSHADGALARLAAGCDACFGPALDGGYYLVALTRSLPELFALPADAWGGPDVLELSLRAASDAGILAAVLDTERDLDTPADARALLADPALPDEVAAALRTPAAP
jgi:rSAM/selenodomain-associated transferase 1